MRKLIKLAILAVTFNTIAGCDDPTILYPPVTEQEPTPAPNVTVINNEAPEKDLQPSVRFIIVSDDDRELSTRVLLTRGDNSQVVPFAGDTALLEVGVSYRAEPLEIEGYTKPSVEEIPGSQVRLNHQIVIRLPYTSTVEVQCLVAVDQFSNRIPAQAFLNGAQEVGLNDDQGPTGKFCGKLKAGDEVTFVSLAGYQDAPRMTWYKSDLTTRLTQVRFTKPGAANECHTLYNSARQEVNGQATYFVDGVESKTKCTAVDAHIEHRFGYSFLQGHYGLSRYNIRAGALTEGATRMVDRHYVTGGGGQRQVCVRTIPERKFAEVSHRGNSIGWAITQHEPACATIDVVSGASIQSVTVQPRTATTSVKVHPLQNDSSYLTEYVALLDSDRMMLTCVTTRAPYGGVLLADVAVNTSSTAITYESQIHCEAINPTVYNEIRCGDNTNPNNSAYRVIRPPVREIQANEFAPGDFLMHVCEYVEDRTPVQPGPQPKQIRLTPIAPAISNGTQMLNGIEFTAPIVSITSNQRGLPGYISQEVDKGWNVYLQPHEIIEIEFGDSGSLIPQTRLMTLDWNGINVSPNPMTGIYEFGVQYLASTPVSLVCAEVNNHNGNRVGVGVEFDGNYSNVRWNDLPCEFLSLHERHQVWSYRPAGYAWDRLPNRIPPNTMTSGQLTLLKRQHAPESRFAEICVQTEHRMGNVSTGIPNAYFTVVDDARNLTVFTGWSDALRPLGHEACFNIDVTYPYVVEATAMVNGQLQTESINLAINEVRLRAQEHLVTITFQ